jgi:hypothetical protein
MVSQFIETGKQFIENYSLSSDEKTKVETLIDYFFGCGCDKPISKNKGILLIGSIGVGKTLTMKIIQRMQPRGEKLRFTSCQYVVDAYDNEGESGTDDYKTTRVYLFDDIGEENRGKHYGKDVEVMEKIIMARYNLYQSSGVKTYFTTNNSPDQLKDRYGERAFDRLKEMCSFISWPGSESKRTKGIPAKREKQPDVIISEEDKRRSSTGHVIRTFQHYKNTGDIIDFGNVAYLFLERIGLINYSAERKKKIYQEVKQFMIHQIDMAAMSSGNLDKMRRAKALINQLANGLNGDVVMEARRLALKEYFDNLIEMEEDISVLMSEIEWSEF